MSRQGTWTATTPLGCSRRCRPPPDPGNKGLGGQCSSPPTTHSSSSKPTRCSRYEDGAVRPLLILREALATAWAAKVPSALVVVLVATMCASTLATVGRTAAAEAQLLDRLDSAGSRVLIVADTARNELITPTIVDQTALLSTSERAVGTLIPVDVVHGVSGAGRTRVPSCRCLGHLTAVARLRA